MRTSRVAKLVWTTALGAAVIGTVALGVVLATDGTNAFKNYSTETCDGHRPMRSPEEAAEHLVVSALRNDRDGVCRAAGARPDLGKGWVTPQMVEELRQIFQTAGITEHNLKIDVPPEHQAGSHYLVYAGNGTPEDAGKIAFGADAVWTAGYTVSFPEGVNVPPFPEEPGHPSQSASASSEVGDPASSR